MDVPPPKSSRAWPIAFTLVAIVAILTGFAIYVFQSLRSAPGDVVEVGREVLSDLGSVAAAFRSGSVQTTFVNYAAKVSGTSFLQVARLDQTEVYTQEDSGAVLWGNLALPDVVVAATVPAEYTYYLDLNDSWEFSLGNGSLRVVAPEIRFNTPALDVSGLHFDVRESSFFRDEEAAIDQLRSGLSELSSQRAADHLSLIRETARRHTEEFVGTWLAGAFGDAASYHVEVLFVDEVTPDEAVEQRPKG